MANSWYPTDEVHWVAVAKRRLLSFFPGSLTCFYTPARKHFSFLRNAIVTLSNVSNGKIKKFSLFFFRKIKFHLIQFGDHSQTMHRYLTLESKVKISSEDALDTLTVDCWLLHHRSRTEFTQTPPRPLDCRKSQPPKIRILALPFALSMIASRSTALRFARFSSILFFRNFVFSFFFYFYFSNNSYIIYVGWRLSMISH